MNNYQYYYDKYKEYGEVTQIKYPIIEAIGLPSVKLDEVVVFESGEMGQVLSLGVDTAKIMLFSPSAVKTGTKICRIGQNLVIPTGEQMLGKMLNPFGAPISSKDETPATDSARIIDSDPPSIAHRAKITKPLDTGMSIVDIVVPLGQGQKQLILGDRKTGKSSFVLSVIKNQIQQGSIAIFAAIGKKKSDIKALESFMYDDPEIRKNMTIIATTAFDSPALIYLTPYTAMTLAEYFRDQGRNVIVVMDDLLTHAKFYREFSLLAETFPGRDSYPGNIFHIHAKLLERAGNFKMQKGIQDTSISCLPIVETQEADLSGYIVSNLMSITDGHLFFDGNVYAKGQRPAINIPLSVTRVGKQTQDMLMKNINRELTSLFSVYQKVESLSHFGSELSSSAKATFMIGEKIQLFFNQDTGLTLPKEVYLIVLSLIWLNVINTVDEIEKTRSKLLIAYQNQQNHDFLSSVIKVETFNDLLRVVGEKKEQIMKMAT